MYKLANKIILHIGKIKKNEKDKWESGMKNEYYIAEDIYDSVKELFKKKGWIQYD